MQLKHMGSGWRTIGWCMHVRPPAESVLMLVVVRESSRRLNRTALKQGRTAVLQTPLHANGAVELVHGRHDFGDDVLPLPPNAELCYRYWSSSEHALHERYVPGSRPIYKKSYLALRMLSPCTSLAKHFRS